MLYFSLLIIAASVLSQGEKKQSPHFYTYNYKKSIVHLEKVQDTTLQNSMKRGASLYSDFCMQCHMAEGTGVAGTFPPLAKSDYLTEKTIKSIKAVKYGLQGKIMVNGESYQSAMPKPGLYDDEVADVMNYILNSWGNEHSEIITEEQVSSIEQE
ncbi:MAG TPA: cytochrome c [Leeuwenhoekiella sp.]|nr:cytochrome c [Leeuwenhoekiella sp.]